MWPCEDTARGLATAQKGPGQWEVLQVKFLCLLVDPPQHRTQAGSLWSGPGLTLQVASQHHTTQPLVRCYPHPCPVLQPQQPGTARWMGCLLSPTPPLCTCSSISQAKHRERVPGQKSTQLVELSSNTISSRKPLPMTSGRSQYPSLEAPVTSWPLFPQPGLHRNELSFHHWVHSRC